MADPNVRIIVTATDKASGVLHGIADETGKLGDANQQVIGSFTELNSVIALGERAFRMAQDVIRETVGTLMEYAQQVEDVARATGMNTDEASRWIQIADDVKIGYDEIKVAMKFAIQQGISPSIEGMKELSAQYLAIQDPVARSAFLIDTFGRSGMNMGRLLELGATGIDALNKGVNKNLILTPDVIEATKDYYAEIDNLGDSVEGVKVKLGTVLLPVMKAVTKETNLMVNEMIAAIDRLSNSWDNLPKPLQEFWKFINKNTSGTDELNTKLYELADVLGKDAYELSRVVTMTDLQNLSVEDLTKLYGGLTLSITEADGVTQGMTYSMDAHAVATSASAHALQQYDLAMQDADMRQAAKDMEAAKLAAERLATAEGELAGAARDVESAIKGAAMSLGEQIYSAFKAEDIKLPRDFVAIIDQIMGTGLGREEDIIGFIENMVGGFDPTKPEEFKKQLQEAYNEFVLSDPKVVAAREQLQLTIDKWKEFDELTTRYDIWIYTHWVDIGNPPGGGTGRPYTCFTGDTNILMADGTIKTINSIAPDDWIMAHNITTNQVMPGQVEKVLYHPADQMAGYWIITAGDNTLKVTPEHPIYSSGEWVKAGELQVGDNLINSDGEAIEITAIKWADTRCPVYNLHMKDEPHNYFANNILVHNKEPKEDTSGRLASRLSGGAGNISLSLTFNGMQGGVTQTTIDQIGQSIREALTSGIAHAGSY